MHYNEKHICVRVSNAAIEMTQSPSFLLLLTFFDFRKIIKLTITQSTQ